MTTTPGSDPAIMSIAMDNSVVTFTSYDPGECTMCLEPVANLSDTCDGGHGDLAAEFALADQYAYLLERIQRKADELCDDSTQTWHFQARNVGWTHSSSEGLIDEVELEAEAVLTMLVHNRRIDDYRITVDTSDPAQLSFQLLHHDAMFDPERFTLTPVSVVDA